MCSKSSAWPILLLASVFLTVHVVSSANILVYMAVGSYSHRLSMWPYIEDLAEAGHNITFLCPFVHKKPNPKVYDYEPQLWSSRLGDWNDHINFFELRRGGRQAKLWAQMPFFGIFACESLYEDEQFIKWMKTTEKFDLVIVDTLFNECAYGMVHHWNSKLIVYSTASVTSWYQDQFGLPDETASVTDPMFGFPSGKEMTFLQRFLNGMAPLVWTAARDWWYLPKLEDISRTGLEKVTGKKGRVEFPSFGEIEKNANLVFVTHHHSMSYPRSFPPNMIGIGGVTIPEVMGSLPKELEDFIGNKKDDKFVYVSLGSVAEFTRFPEAAQKEFIDALRAFPDIKFIWKTKVEIKNLPGNIKQVTWAPQIELLAHPKIKGFITHSGLGSTTEAIVFGVPVVTFPVFAEQDMNSGMLASRGAGITLELIDINKETMEKAIKEILKNPK